jgi:hypothetical protein
MASKTTNDNQRTPLTEGEIKFARMVEDKGAILFGSIDHEHLFRTLRAIKALGYSIVELRPVEELFRMGVKGD